MGTRCYVVNLVRPFIDNIAPYLGLETSHVMRIYSIVKHADIRCYGDGLPRGRRSNRPTSKEASEARSVPKLVSFVGYNVVWEGLRHN